MTQTDNVAETNQPEQPGNAWVRSTFYGLAARTVVVRCPLCHHDHPHPWQYESGDEDPGERPAPCGRGRYVVRLRRAVRERLPNKPPPICPSPSCMGVWCSPVRRRRAMGLGTLRATVSVGIST